MEKPIYLTTTRLLYNIARVDYDYGRVDNAYLEMRKTNWEIEYNSPDYEEKFKKKYDSSKSQEGV